MNCFNQPSRFCGRQHAQ